MPEELALEVVDELDVADAGAACDDVVELGALDGVDDELEAVPPQPATTSAPTTRTAASSRRLRLEMLMCV